MKFFYIILVSKNKESFAVLKITIPVKVFYYITCSYINFFIRTYLLKIYLCFQIISNNNISLSLSYAYTCIKQKVFAFHIQNNRNFNLIASPIEINCSSLQSRFKRS